MGINKQYAIAIVVTNFERKIIWVNDNFESMTGYSFDEAYQKKPAFLQGEKTDKNVLTYMSNKLNRLEPLTTSLIDYRKNGEEYKCVLQIFPLTMVNGATAHGFIAVEYETELNDHHPTSPIKILDDQIKTQTNHKYEESHLELKFEIILLGKVINYLEKNRRYLLPQSMKQLSQTLKTNPKYLSQSINRNTNYNFRQFLNSFRIRDFKKLLLDPEYKNLTIEGLAYKCGFQNKATFFNAFRAAEGMTPMEYKKKMLA